MSTQDLVPGGQAPHNLTRRQALKTAGIGLTALGAAAVTTQSPVARAAASAPQAQATTIIKAAGYLK